MSFILDALKKSESDRQRQSGPALFEVKVAPPKSRFPVWAVAIVALLVVNMGIVGWMLLRRSSHSEDTIAANTASSAATPAAGALVEPPIVPGAGSVGRQLDGTPTNKTPPSSASSGGPQSGNPPSGNMSAGSMSPNNKSPDSISASGQPPASAAAAGASAALSQPQSSSAQNQQGGTGTAQSRMPERDQNEPTLGNTTPAGNAREAGGANTDSASNPDDFAPASEPGSPLFKGHVKRGTESGLALYQDAALAPGANLPQLRLDLHVYAAKPQDRFALINMHKMREGDSLQGGVRVESITPDGVVMSHDGSKFLLPRD
jgi:general secretion pathway protein B